MKSKTFLYLVIAFIILSIGQHFLYKYQNSILVDENFALKKEKKKELKIVRDSAFKKIQEITVLSSKKFDSIINIPEKIKWQFYEKPIYINRNLDTALDIHSEYKANSNAKK